MELAEAAARVRAEELKRAQEQEAYRLPTRAEHAAQIRKLWIICILIAFAVFLASGSTVAALALKGHPWVLIVAVSTAVFQVIVMSYALAFFVPSFLTSLAKLSLGIEMSRQALEYGTKTVSVLDKIDQTIDARTAKADAIMAKLDRVATRLDAKVEGGLIERLEDHIQVIRTRVERDTKPLPDAPRHRPEAVGEEAHKAAGNGG